jgi:tRNA nucleotidyltransferase (CCA-adding enzyme)
MSDYMFMLESHLSANQNRAVSVVQATAAQASVNLFLTGGAVRDMLGGFPLRDLDFTVEGNALKLAKTIEAKAQAKVTGVDEYRKSVNLLFPGRVTAAIAMARQERYPKNGARPVIAPATIQEDLRCRDFTVNAIALSLNQASLGLLLDPNNGAADLEHKELRTVYGRALYDDPGRLLRLVRFRVRFGFTIEARTQMQYENARLEEMEKRVSGRRLFEELIEIASEANPGEVLHAFEQERLLSLFSPALTGPKLNLAGFSRLMKARQLIPFGVDLPINGLALFLHLVTEKLTPKEKALLAATTGMHKAESALVPKLAASAKKLEREAKSAKITKPSQVYGVFSKVAGEELLFLYLTSDYRLVQDRIRNYLQKYLPAAQEITDRQVTATGLEPGTPKFRKLKEEMILARLDGRPKRSPAPAPEAASVPGRPRGPEPAKPPAKVQAWAGHGHGR